MRLAFVVVVAGRALALERRNIDRRLTDMLDPRILRFRARLDAGRAARQRFLDDVGDVMTLLAVLLGGGIVDSTLLVTDEELIREVGRHQAVQRLVTIGPMLVDR